MWDGRPYHIFGQLLLLKPWKSNFDTATESITQVDMWIRTPNLPVEYISFDVLKTILEWNNLGELIKLDPYTEKKQRLRYARLCINVDLLKIVGNKIVVPDENAQEHSYNVWFEEFPDGCRYCRAGTHTYNLWPMKIARNQTITVTLSKPMIVKEQKMNKAEPSGTKEDEAWEKVGRIYPTDAEKGKGFLPIPEMTKNKGIKIIYKTESSSSGSKDSKFSLNSFDPLLGGDKETGIDAAKVDINEEQRSAEMTTLPNDDQEVDYQAVDSLNPYLCQNNDEEENDTQLMNKFMMEDEEFKLKEFKSWPLLKQK